MSDKVLNLLGLAMRARKIVLGEEFVIKTMTKTNKTVFLAKDAGENITKKIIDKANSFNCVVIKDYSSDELSQAIGKENRKVILIDDLGFSRKIQEYINS